VLLHGTGKNETLYAKLISTAFSTRYHKGKGMVQILGKVVYQYS